MIHLLLSLSLLYSNPQSAIRGVVTTKIESCDYFLVYTNMGYILMEARFFGDEPEIGDYVYGELHTYNSRKIWNETKEEEMNVWIEDWGLSKGKALEQLVEKCD